MVAFANPSESAGKGDGGMRRVSTLLSFLLFLALCASIAYWALQFFTPDPRPVAPPPAAAATPPPRLEAAAALFGGRAATATASASSAYQLRGVILGPNLKDSVVVLASEGKPAQAYRAGREIAPGVKVKEVRPGFVVLTENGEERRLELPTSARTSGRFESPVASAPVSSAPAGRDSYSPPTQAPAAPNAVSPSGSAASGSGMGASPASGAAGGAAGGVAPGAAGTAGGTSGTAGATGASPSGAVNPSGGPPSGRGPRQMPVVVNSPPSPNAAGASGAAGAAAVDAAAASVQPTAPVGGPQASAPGATGGLVPGVPQAVPSQ